MNETDSTRMLADRKQMRERDDVRRRVSENARNEKKARVQRIRDEHDLAFSTPLIDASLLTDADRLAAKSRAVHSGQRYWNLKGGST